MPFISSHLNLFSSIGSKKLDIDALEDSAVISHPDKIVLDSVVDIGDHADVASVLTTVKADIISNFSSSTTAAALVQSNLDALTTSSAASIGALQAADASEAATRVAALAAAATARVDADAVIQTALDAEVATRTSDVAAATAAVATETTARTAADTAEAAARVAADAVLQAAVDVEKARVDSILSGSEVSLDNLKKVVDVYREADNNVLKILVGLQTQISDLTSIINSLTEGSHGAVLDLEAVVAELVLVGGKAWLTKSFHMVFDLLQQYDFSTDTFLSWITVKAGLIAGSSGALTASSTDAEVKAYYDAVLVAQYGSKYSGSPEAAQLTYDDHDHYLLTTALPAGSKPLFLGSAVSTASDVVWRMDYCTTAGDETTAYSSILSGTKAGNVLTVVPASVETPVNGLSGTRVGFKVDVDSLSVGL